MSAQPNVHERVAELVQLAANYADDGAFRTAAARLRAAAALYDQEGDRRADFLLTTMKTRES